ncbi:MAG: hypothetical protein AB4352_14555, partial [Hormoscilla sp.]
ITTSIPTPDSGVSRVKLLRSKRSAQSMSILLKTFNFLWVHQGPSALPSQIKGDRWLHFVAQVGDSRLRRALRAIARERYNRYNRFGARPRSLPRLTCFDLPAASDHIWSRGKGISFDYRHQPQATLFDLIIT